MTADPWQTFLASVRDGTSAVPAPLCAPLLDVWALVVRQAGANVLAPRVSPWVDADDAENDARIVMSWSTDAMYAEIEIGADGIAAWFVTEYAPRHFAGSGEGPPPLMPPFRFWSVLPREGGA